MFIQPQIRTYVEQIKNDRNQGASELARQSLEVIKIGITKSNAVNVEQFVTEINGIVESLCSARPVMAPIKNAVQLFQKRLLEN